jgi:cytochrome c553
MTFRLATFAACAVALGAAAVAFAQAPAPFVPDARMAALGEQLWNETASCRNCHGTKANGVADVPQEPNGANLHLTQLDPDQLAEVIKCGRPGTAMPYFAAGSYTDRKCYDMTAADAGGTIPTAGQPQLAERQINGLVAFIFSRFVGKP